MQAQITNYLQEEGFKETEIGLIPEEWDMVRLGEVLEEVKLRAKSLMNYRSIPIFSLSKNEGLIPQEKRFKHRVAKKDVSDYKVVRKGWLVYNPYVIWEGALSTLNKHDVALVSPAYVIFKIKKANYKYLDYLFKTKKILQIFFSLASGVVQRRRSISKQAFLNVKIPFPPVEEQNRIAYVLSTIQKAIGQQDKTIEAAKNLKKSLRQKLFTEGLGHTEFKETEIGQMPADWKVRKLGEDNILTLTQYGLSLKGQKKGKYPILRMSNLVNGYVDINDLQFVDVDNEVFEKFQLVKGDILFNRTNSIELVGKTSIFTLEDNFVFASYLIRLKINPKTIDPYFLNFCLNWEPTQARLKSLASRAVSQANISATRLKTLGVPVPSLSEQQEIARILSTVDKKIEVEEKKKNGLKELFKTLLHKLMTAEVRPKDMEV